MPPPASSIIRDHRFLVSEGGEREREMAAVLEGKEWVLISYAEEGLPSSDHLQLRETSLVLDEASIPDGHVALQVLWLSVDPYLRSRMTGRHDGLCAPQFELNKVTEAFGIGKVISSKSDGYHKGDTVVYPFCSVAHYCVAPANGLQKIDARTDVSHMDYLNALGIPGFAAWVGICQIGEPKPGDNVFISAAAGGVGVLAGQLAKIKGCRVIGSAGTDEKVRLLKEEFKFDDAFNYKKETDLDAALSKYFPDGIDIYFDNVGGKTLEAVLNHINLHARIAVCGMISQYNQKWTDREGVRNLLNVVGKGAKIQGFMLGHQLQHFEVFRREMTNYIKQGKVISKTKIYYGIETFLESLVSVFSSSNIGKVVIQVCREAAPDGI